MPYALIQSTKSWPETWFKCWVLGLGKAILDSFVFSCSIWLCNVTDSKAALTEHFGEEDNQKLCWCVRSKQGAVGELVSPLLTWGHAAVFLSTFHTVRFQLRNRYVCIWNSEILPDAETPLDGKTGAWTWWHQPAISGRNSSATWTSPHSISSTFCSYFGWAMTLKTFCAFKTWSRLCGSCWSHTGMRNVSSQWSLGLGDLCCSPRQASNARAGPQSDLKEKGWNQIIAFSLWSRYLSTSCVCSMNLSRPFPFPIVQSWWCCWRDGVRGCCAACQALLPRSVTSVSYLSCWCHASLMSQFWSRDAPAAIWEGSGPKNI